MNRSYRSVPCRVFAVALLAPLFGLAIAGCGDTQPEGSRSAEAPPEVKQANQNMMDFAKQQSAAASKKK